MTETKAPILIIDARDTAKMSQHLVEYLNEMITSCAASQNPERTFLVSEAILLDACGFLKTTVDNLNAHLAQQEG